MTQEGARPTHSQLCESVIRLEVQIRYERELREAAQEEAARALDKQAKEYERRLENLNGEAARLAAQAATYVRQDVLEEQLRSLRRQIQDVVTELAKVGTQHAEERGAATRTTLIIGFVFAIVTLVLRFAPIP